VPALVIFAVILLGTACSEQPVEVEAAAAPVIDAASVSANPHNVLSAIVCVRARNTDSVSVSFKLVGAAATTVDTTPFVSVSGDSTVVPLLGLLPERGYELHVIAHGRAGRAVAAGLTFMTGPLPDDLPRFTAGGSDPSPGYVLFSRSPYALVIDNTGRIVWYRHFANGPGLSFMAQLNGHYVAHPTTPDPTDAESFIELDVLGNVTRRLGCARGLASRFHDLIALPNGDWWILCDEMRIMDLASIGGVAGARVTGTAVQKLSARGELLFHWSPFDHFAITDLGPAERSGPIVNWTHGNALDMDSDGNLILSSRNLGEITKIDATTGHVIWRLGGRANQFTFLNTAAPAFSRQHSARAVAPGALLLLDNVGDPQESRAEYYVVDAGARTARLAHSYGAGALTQLGGSVQDLGRGRALVSFGTAGLVQEYDQAGRVVWQIVGNAGYVFRAQRIASLYAPGVGTSR
jgi:hypothetical protein